MTTKNLKFYNIRDRKPADGQEILYIDVSEWYGTVKPEIGTVDYCWFEYDEDGPTGCQISYDSNHPTPKGCKLHLMIGNRIVDQSDLWWTEASCLDQFS